MQQLLLEILFASILASPSAPALAGESAAPPSVRPEGASREGDAPAARASPATRTRAGSLAIEVIEAGPGAERRFALTVPVDGELDAWVDAAGSRRCRASARPLDAEMEVEIKCSGGKAGDELRLRARRSFGAGERVQVAAVERGGGRTVAVFVQAKP